jgi:hypothetical protein
MVNDGKPVPDETVPTQKRDLSHLYPGREVPLRGGEHLTVYPIGLQHVEEFTQRLAAAGEAVLEALQGLVVKGKTGGEEGVEFTLGSIAGQLPALVRAVRVHLLDFVNRFCDAELTKLPHHVQLRAIEAWLDENFYGEAALDPLTRVMGKLLGQATEAMTSATSSTASSPAGSTRTPSSTGSTGTDGAGPCPIPAGAGTDSGTTPAAPGGT